MQKMYNYAEKPPLDPFETRKCPRCGRVFCPAPWHQYRTERQIFCSYTCYNDSKKSRRKKETRYYYNIYIDDCPPITALPDSDVVRTLFGTAPLPSKCGIAQWLKKNAESGAALLVQGHYIRLELIPASDE